MLGYPKNLYILPFDHRSSFIKTFIGAVKELDGQQKKLISDYKKIIFEGFLMSLGYVKNPVESAIMVDEDFGLEIIKLAKKKNIIICLPVEKSGQNNFAFQYGHDFSQHIQALKPDIVKALVRYNPADKKINQGQLEKIKELDSWCKDNSYKFMVESLVPPTPGQLKRARGRREVYDEKIRPALTLRMINEFHQAGIEPDIWKIEAFEHEDAWSETIDAICDGERSAVAIIMLGRGESFAKVKTWMSLAPRHQLSGFAVGRTIFLRPLVDFHQKRISKKECMTEIAKNYIELIRYWEK